MPSTIVKIDEYNIIKTLFKICSDESANLAKPSRQKKINLILALLEFL